MRIITVSNQKGGVSKTTTVHCIGAGLGHIGKKVLLLDLDPQSNLTNLCGAITDAEDESTITMLEVLVGEANINDAIQKKELYDVVPSSLFLASIDGRIPNVLSRPYRLQTALKDLHEDYDYILIDTPPALGTLTSNALIAADSVLIPAQADVLSLQGISQLYETIEAAKEHANPKLSIDGIILTRFNDRTNLTKKVTELFDAAAGQLNTKVFNTRIRENVKIKEAQAEGIDVFTKDPKCNGSLDYNALIKEIFGLEVENNE